MYRIASGSLRIEDTSFTLGFPSEDGKGGHFRKITFQSTKPRYLKQFSDYFLKRMGVGLISDSSVPNTFSSLSMPSSYMSPPNVIETSMAVFVSRCRGFEIAPSCESALSLVGEDDVISAEEREDLSFYASAVPRNE